MIEEYLKAIGQALVRIDKKLDSIIEKKPEDPLLSVLKEGPKVDLETAYEEWDGENLITRPPPVDETPKVTGNLTHKTSYGGGISDTVSFDVPGII